MFRLVRETPLKDDCTLGILRDPNDLAICCTLELAWRDNMRGLSCIPVGEYFVTRHTSKKNNLKLGGQVFLLHDVPDRDAIQIHIGNTVKDSRGCILVGRTYNKIGNDRAVMHSTETMERLLRDLPEEFMLRVE